MGMAVEDSGVGEANTMDHVGASEKGSMRLSNYFRIKVMCSHTPHYGEP